MSRILGPGRHVHQRRISLRLFIPGGKLAVDARNGGLLPVRHWTSLRSNFNHRGTYSALHHADGLTETLSDFTMRHSLMKGRFHRFACVWGGGRPPEGRPWGLPNQSPLVTVAGSREPSMSFRCLRISGSFVPTETTWAIWLLASLTSPAA